MTEFPTGFSDDGENRLLNNQSIDTLSLLDEKGYDIYLGITESETRELFDITLQPSIREYCPKDCSTRFRDIDSTKAWLAKGHQMYLLKEKQTGQIAGYAWSGNGSSPHIPGGKITCALRLNEDFQGRGLATPFLATVIAHTKLEHPDQLIWLEGWESNVGAIHIYKKLGFELVTSEASTRPTRDGEMVEDVRLFMQLPSSTSLDNR